ncbi:MAG: tripartite tricarboxylate transporter TctB family protein [Gemmatimonadales bacterium]
MERLASRILGVAVVLASGAAVVIALDWPLKARLFPIAIGVPVFCMAAAEVVWGLLRPDARVGAMDFRLSEHLPGKTAARRTFVVIAWMLGFLAGIVLAGFPIAVPLLVFLYAKLGREPWGLSLGLALGVWGLFYAVFDRMLHLPFPAGWIQTWLGLA